MVRERAFWFGLVTVVAFLGFGGSWLDDLSNPLWLTGMFLWLFVAMLWLSFSVVHHADALAEILGEPYGTLILTVSVISIEVVMIAAVMLAGSEHPTLARDTMFAVLMIVLNGMVGLTLLAGGLRHHQQSYNLQSANSFLSLLIPLAVLGLILPRFSTATTDLSLSTNMAIFLAIASAVLYAVFLRLQTTWYKSFFVHGVDSEEGTGHEHESIRSTGYHAALLLMCMVPIVLLSKKMATIVDFGIDTIGAPAALGGFLVAVLVLSPEGLGAFRAARDNRLQRTVNICLGSALATIGLTIPAVLMIGFFTGQPIQLGLDNEEIILLLLTLAVSIVNFSGGKTNAQQGAVHLLLFGAYVLVIFDKV